MKKTIAIILITMLVLTTSALALTVTKNGQTYTATFSNGRVCTGTNLVWNSSAKLITVTVTCSDGKGLRLIDIVELWTYLQGQVGRANQIDRFTITIR